MSRVDNILKLTIPDGIIDSFRLVSAYCSCLTPSQACDLLVCCVIDRVDLRAAALRKVCNDIDTAFSECHIQLLINLLSIFAKADSKGRQSLGYCLSELATHLPHAERSSILEIFLDSKYIGVRRRGYKIAAAEENTPIQAIEGAWHRFSDTECAWVIVKTFPREFITENRAALATCFTEGWQHSQLYLRISQSAPELLSELKAIDEISYCYVLAKRGMKLQDQEAIMIIDRAYKDDRFGLLVWSIGKMQLWNVLQYVEAKLPIIQAQRAAIFMKRYEN